ncbi:MAG: polymer-forming cytoskeletal protein, partial [Chthoniobacterales bacterium]
HGTVLGNITVAEKAELKASSQVTGDLTASRIVIEEGAMFVGKSEVTPNKNSKPAASLSGSGASGNQPSANRPDASKSEPAKDASKEPAKA